MLVGRTHCAMNHLEFLCNRGSQGQPSLSGVWGVPNLSFLFATFGGKRRKERLGTPPNPRLGASAPKNPISHHQTHYEALI